MKKKKEEIYTYGDRYGYKTKSCWAMPCHIRTSVYPFDCYEGLILPGIGAHK